MEDMVANMGSKGKALYEAMEGGDKKPYLKKHDGYVTICTEDKEISWEDHDGNKTSVTVKKGDGIYMETGGYEPKIMDGEDFFKKNKLVDNPGKKHNPESDGMVERMYKKQTEEY